MLWQFISLSQLLKTFILTIIIVLACVLLKHSIIRQYYNKIIPTLNIRFIDILGHYHLLTYRNECNGYSVTTYLWQFICGVGHLFKKNYVFMVWAGYSPLIYLNSPEAVEEILTGTSTTEKNWTYGWVHCWLGNGLLTSSGTKWRSRRKLLTPAFHFDILKDFLQVINEKSRKLVNILEKETMKDFTDIVHPLSLCSLDIICETTLGVNIEAQENSSSNYVKAVKRVSHSIVKRMDHPWSWSDFTYFRTSGRSVRKDIQLLHDFTTSVIRAKKSCLSINSKNAENHKPKRKALMDILLEHHVETKELTDEDIREEVDTFTFAGHDTTSMALSWSLYLIGLHGDIQAKLCDELDDIFGDDCENPVTNGDLKNMKYLECVIKESLRLYPPVSLFGRKSDKNVISGCPIPRNSSLLICPYMLHRNEDIFPNPEEFDPDRFAQTYSKNHPPYAYIPFSAGPRNCIGQRFAMMEIKTVISHILRNYTLESLCPRDKVLPCLDLILRPTNGIKMKIRPRHLADVQEMK